MVKKILQYIKITKDNIGDFPYAAFDADGESISLEQAADENGWFTSYEYIKMTPQGNFYGVGDKEFDLEDQMDMEISSKGEELKEIIKKMPPDAVIGTTIKCPNCGSLLIRKHGPELHSDGWHQRMQCKACFHDFTIEAPIDDGGYIF